MTAAESPDLGARLFSYAVITDTHLNQGEDECNSPFAVNKLANGRMRFVVRDLNARELAFVIHLGDLLHPVPAIPHLYRRAAALFVLPPVRHVILAQPRRAVIHARRKAATLAQRRRPVAHVIHAKPRRLVAPAILAGPRRKSKSFLSTKRFRWCRHCRVDLQKGIRGDAGLSFCSGASDRGDSQLDS